MLISWKQDDSKFSYLVSARSLNFSFNSNNWFEELFGMVDGAPFAPILEGSWCCKSGILGNSLSFNLEDIGKESLIRFDNVDDIGMFSLSGNSYK